MDKPPNRSGPWYSEFIPRKPGDPPLIDFSQIRDGKIERDATGNPVAFRGKMGPDDFPFVMWFIKDSGLSREDKKKQPPTEP